MGVDGFSTIIPFLDQYIFYATFSSGIWKRFRTIQNSFENGDRKRLPDDFRWRKNEFFHGPSYFFSKKFEKLIFQKEATFQNRVFRIDFFDNNAHSPFAFIKSSSKAYAEVFCLRTKSSYFILGFLFLWDFWIFFFVFLKIYIYKSLHQYLPLWWDSKQRGENRGGEGRLK